MRATSRVVWSEGMHLAQHHFQAQSAWFEHLAAGVVSLLNHGAWGVAGVQLDEEALLNGTAALVAARGIMPDGLAFSFPEDRPPEPLRIAEIFSPTQASHLLLLAVPAEAPGRANVAATPTEPLRFAAVERPCADEMTGGDERPVQFAQKNFRLLLEGEPADGMVTLPVARVQRDGAGHFMYDPEFIGPCLQLSASRRLRDIVARLVEALESKTEAVRAERASSGGTAEYAPREVAGFWFAHALNAAIPPLRHALQGGAVHPEVVYGHMARLAGALCTFSLTAHPREIPAYDHAAPEACFRTLERHIRRHLDVILPVDAVNLALLPGAESFFSTSVTDRRCLEPAAQWYLGVRSSASAADVVARVPRVVKVCSARFIERLVREAYPGMTIEHVPVPPAELGPRAGMHYFAVRPADRNPCWLSIVETAEVGVYVPDSVPDAEVELKVVLPRRD